MFSKFKNRMMQGQPQNYPYNNYQNPYNMIDNNNYNSYDFSRIDEQINELKRINTDLLKRINRLENYLGIKTESEASNYYFNK